jgi:hypothetical protein
MAPQQGCGRLFAARSKEGVDFHFFAAKPCQAFFYYFPLNSYKNFCQTKSNRLKLQAFCSFRPIALIQDHQWQTFITNKAGPYPEVFNTLNLD